MIGCRGRFLSGILVGILSAAAAAATGPHVSLAVDATEAPRKILHAREKIPATPGTLTLYYPKRMPGEHAPTGPINDLAGLRFTASGQTLKWRRDLLESSTISVELRGGKEGVDAVVDYREPA